MGGVVLQLMAAALLRTSLASKWPWLTVLVMELANEVYDLQVERWPSFGMQLGEGVRDVVGTMLLPALLWWIARAQPPAAERPPAVNGSTERVPPQMEARSCCSSGQCSPPERSASPCLR